MQPVKLIERIDRLRQEVRELKRQGARIGLVPTMGYLHEGHLSLVQLAKSQTDAVFVSIFVNPTQFNQQEDLKLYPRDMARDLRLLENIGAYAVFSPSDDSIYGAQFGSWIEVPKLASTLEGEFRPGHFKGVATIVGILFNIFEPDVAVFGEKDFQQLRLIEQMVADLKFGVKVLRGALVREKDGLAMSSRNVRLSSAARKVAPQIYEALSEAVRSYQAGEKSSKVLQKGVQEKLANSGAFKIEYVTVARESDLKEIEMITEPSRILVAVWLEKVRLIDNIALVSSE